MLPWLTRTALLAALGACVAPPTTASAAVLIAPTPRERSQALLAEGDEAYEGERFEEAVTKYRASYDALDGQDRSGYIGSLPLRKAMRAYAQLVEAESDPERLRPLLESQYGLLDAFLTEVSATPGAAEQVGDDLIAELGRTRSEVADALADLPDPSAPEPVPDPVPEPGPTPPPPPADKPALDPLGLGLVIGGGAALLTGIGISIGHATIRSSARDLAGTSPDFAVGTEARASYLEDEDARARRFLIAGSVIGAVGLATAIGGTIRLVLHRGKQNSRATALRLTPAFGPRHAGISVARRF